MAVDIHNTHYESLGSVLTTPLLTGLSVIEGTKLKPPVNDIQWAIFAIRLTNTANLWVEVVG